MNYPDLIDTAQRHLHSASDRRADLSRLKEMVSAGIEDPLALAGQQDTLRKLQQALEQLDRQREQALHDHYDRPGYWAAQTRSRHPPGPEQRDVAVDGRRR